MLEIDFMYEDAPIVWTFSESLPVTSLEKLLKRFYENCIYSPRPLHQLRDPLSPEGQPYYDVNSKWIVMMYRGDFRVVIEKAFGAENLTGPHAARLMYQSSWTKEIFWIGICQINALWWSDDRMLFALLTAIKDKEFYQSERSARTMIPV